MDNLGKWFDYFVLWTMVEPLYKIFRISTLPSQSHWSIIPLFISMATFFVALAIQFSLEGSTMIATALWIVAYVFIFITLCLSIYFLRHQNTGNSNNEAIDKLGTRIESKLDELIKEIRQRR